MCEEKLFKLAKSQRKANSDKLAKMDNAWYFQRCEQTENF